MARHNPALKKAIEQLGLAGIARLYDPPISRQSINDWKRKGIPPHRCRALSAATGIPLHELRPDLFLPPDPSFDVKEQEASDAAPEPSAP